MISAGLTTYVDENASLEEKVEFLLRRDRDAQRIENDLGRRLRAIEEEAPRRLEELRAGMEQHVATTLEDAFGEYRPLRAFGAFLLAAGLGLVTAGNFF